jgi:type II secretory ATPase GspE/PulE/Tfp pilus assembly ATPase PilB-like protein
MSDIIPFPNWELTLLPEPLSPSEADAKARRQGFAWPTPPYANYPDSQEQTDPLPCEVVGRNGKTSHGRLTFFVPDQQVAHLQSPPARTTFPLHFGQFRCLVLTTPLAPLTLAPEDPHAQMLGPRNASPYRIALASGGEMTGETVGHVKTDFGLFLFPPSGENGSVLRMFVPRQAYTEADLGQRIGELLIEQQHATPEQVEQAVRAQEALRRQKIGDILVLRQVVSPDQLLEALDRQARMPLVRIGDALLSMGLIDQAQLEAALEQQKVDRSVPLGELLVRMNVVSRDDLQEALSRKMGYPLVDLDAFPVEPEALRRLAYSVAARLRVMPLLVRDGRLVVALDDPARRRPAVEEVEFNAGMKAVPVLAKCRSMDRLLLSAYEKIGADTDDRAASDPSLPIDMDMPDTGKLVETLEKEGLDPNGHDGTDNIEQSDNSLVRLINNMIIEAHRDGVSDIHVESYPGREKIRIRFRKDGAMRSYLELPAGYRSALIARLKIMCDLDISEKRKPQDGKINFAKFSPQHRIELRVATIPTNSGLEDVVMRILASARPVPLDQLGLSDDNLRQLKEAIERPYGLVLCVGPTGSGKTTTLHSALSHINVPERKIWTAEDPIEITQPGLRQVQVNPKIDWTFAKALRAFLRADPDAIMVGEVRDGETAQMAIEASLTGHLVLSTLHTNSAPETVTRLLDMGMDPFNFADSLLAVLAQRLVRRLCSECRVSEPASDALVDELLGDYMHAFGAGEPPVGRDSVLAGWKQRNSRDGRLLAHRSPGCEHCDGTGFRGRAGLHELMQISRELRHLVQTGSRAEALQQVAMGEGMRTLRQDGIDKVLAGVTTIEEVRATSNS